MGGWFRSKPIKAIAIASLVVIYIIICIFFEDWAPKCIWHLVSGYDCPACGAQRALKYLAEGDFRSGFLMNPYLIAMLPYFVLLFIGECGGDKTASLKRVVTDYRVVIVLGVIMIGWTIFRNMTVWHDVMIRNGLC